MNVQAAALEVYSGLQRVIAALSSHLQRGYRCAIGNRQVLAPFSRLFLVDSEGPQEGL